MRLPPGTRKRCMFCDHIAIRGFTAVIRETDQLLLGFRCTSSYACTQRQTNPDGTVRYRYSRAGGRLITKPMDPASHGTAAGAASHYRRGEKPCWSCTMAARRYNADRAAKYRERRRREAEST
ncbi:MAG TPA: hypothetical protein VJ777_30230 [Mycobacterium sp.]|nr:hypothetical protein [Mycobacterium sp.]